jgi:anti-sigma factor RsiW
MQCEMAKDLTNAYIDGELDPAVSAEMAEHLRGCPACAHAAESGRGLSHALRDSRELRYSAPAASRARLRQAIEARESRPRFRWNTWAASLASATAGAVVVFTLLQSKPEPQSIAQELVGDHIRSLMMTHLTDVPSSDQHTVKPWFAGKLDFSPPVEDFAQQGFELVGGRLDYAAGRPVAALIYRRRMHLINVFVWPARGGETRPAASSLQGYNVIPWNHAGMSYAAVSDLAAPELQSLADLMLRE